LKAKKEEEKYQAPNLGAFFHYSLVSENTLKRGPHFLSLKRIFEFAWNWTGKASKERTGY